MKVANLKTKNDRKLNQSQLRVLLTLYKYRFGTRELIAESLGRRNTNAINSRLNILAGHGYIGIRYDEDYRKNHRPADYYLLPHALRTLRKLGMHKGIDDKAIKNSYGDKSETSDVFIGRCLQLFAVGNKLVSAQPGLQFFTRRELGCFDYLPTPLPDAYVVLKLGTTTKRFFVELFTSDADQIPMSTRLRKLIAYHQDGSWGKSRGACPSVLCVCETSRIERQLTATVNRMLYSAGGDYGFHTTTLRALLKSASYDKIWSSTAQPGRLLELSSIS